MIGFPQSNIRIFCLSDEKDRIDYLTLINDPGFINMKYTDGGQVVNCEANWHNGEYRVFLQWLEEPFDPDKYTIEVAKHLASKKKKKK